VLLIEDLVKIFPASKDDAKDVVAVDHINLDIQEGDLFTMLGPSGCGKTTTLRGVAGLEEPTSGRISVAGKPLFDSHQYVNVPPNKRGLGMVFQSYAIWPHMNVYKNVAYPLKMRTGRQRLPKAEIRARVERVLAAVHLLEYLDRPATDLSGGQQQRLALARALAMEPPLLLLDEPLSNLDAKLREQMRFELKRLQRDLNITAVYVTHDQVEALAMSTKIAVMNGGKVEQVGRPRDIYNNPASRFVADFIGTSNFFEGVVEKKLPGGLYRVATGEGPIEVPSPLDLVAGDDVTVSVRPEHIAIHDEASAETQPNLFRARVLTRAFMGEIVEHEVQVGKLTLHVRCNPSISIPDGTEIQIEMPSEWCSLIPGT
jgi:iron(III) transport system ATP-binding protein